ncbi:MAG: hypothetical protein GC205_02360 [Bacteroidetes bacterium]|nr:hypothetical protein [Bacteroidota bacterium]
MKFFALPLILLGIIVLPSSGIAQTTNGGVNVVWGPEYEGKTRVPIQEIVGRINEELYVIKKDGFLLTKSDFFLERYDDKMNPLTSIPLEMKSYGDYQAIIIHGEKLWMFSSDKSEDNNDVVLNAREIHANTLIPSRKTIEVSKSAKPTLGQKLLKSNFLLGGLANPNLEAKYKFEQSETKKFLAVLSTWPYKAEGENKKTEEALNIQVFDEAMQVVQSRDVVLPWPSFLFDATELRVDDQGNAYLLGIRYEGSRRLKRDGEPNYEYILFKFPKGSETMQEYSIRLDDKFITDMNIAIDENGKIAAAGFYSNTPSFDITGTYYLMVDGRTKQVTKSSTKSFELDFLTEGLTERQEEKMERKAEKGKSIDLLDMELRKLTPMPGGGWLLVGEQYKVVEVTRTTTSTTGITTSSTTTHYYYNDIIVVRISNKGDIDWAHKVPKRQYTVEDGGFYSSFIQSEVDDRIYIVYNDNPKNLTEDKPGKYWNFIPGKESVVMLVQFDAQGNMTKDMLFSSDDAEVIVRPKVSNQIDPETTILAGQRRKTHRLMKISF